MSYTTADLIKTDFQERGDDIASHKNLFWNLYAYAKGLEFALENLKYMVEIKGEKTDE